MLGLTEVDELFFAGVFFLKILLLFGVVGVFAFCLRKGDGGRGGGGGGGGSEGFEEIAGVRDGVSVGGVMVDKFNIKG